MRALLPIVIALGIAAAAPASAATGSRCSRFPAPPRTFDVGARFHGLAVTDRSRLCEPAPPRQPQNTSARVDSVIYGSCDATTEGGCGPPLEDTNRLARAAARRIARQVIAGGGLPSFARLRARAMRRPGCQ